MRSYIIEEYGCSNCWDIILYDYFPLPKHYEECILYIKSLLQTKCFELIYSTCDFDKIHNENGCWNDDIIHHTIKCKECGREFTCSADTYHGGGSFEVSG